MPDYVKSYRMIKETLRPNYSFGKLNTQVTYVDGEVDIIPDDKRLSVKILREDRMPIYMELPASELLPGWGVEVDWRDFE